MQNQYLFVRKWETISQKKTNHSKSEPDSKLNKRNFKLITKMLRLQRETKNLMKSLI